MIDSAISPDLPDSASEQRRFAVVGAGSRARMYTRALVSTHAGVARLAALCDTNSTRMAAHNAIAQEHGMGPVPTYSPDSFSAMLRDERVDGVVVCSVDRTHADYICAALEAGCDVVTEKPMTADAEGCRRILQTQRRTGGRVDVAFNYRYNPVHTRMRELLAEGAVGDIGSVHFEWLLDLRHGADYFRRWHREKENSGGLLVHKASHHFDLVNWWIGAAPERVFAWGDLFFYGDANGSRRGTAAGYERAHGSADAESDPFALHMADSDDMRRLYLDAEHEDGYRRDRNVFGSGITIEDDMSVLVRYDSGAKLSYHLCAYSPWEGYRVAVTGSRGRLELDVTESPYTEPGRTDGTPVRGMPAPKESTTSRLLLRRHWREPEEIGVEVGEGTHGGGDVRMLDTLFGTSGTLPTPTHTDGANALLTGLAADESIRTGAPVDVAALLGDD
ncbi:Gfo/Idh/MocA family protein [Streptomonospora salina]|uniref:Putative dehydrogenase n=1 Tax=Streptomonospora salina TaxID=104205 RepID=A0A841EBZ8_9ACTN|nr:Gfo/Idh/MocA family oxidoreductase [Streptomonospora salina]MBB6000665.1 putative dehydrogenase [Streptomonospora salina]